MKTLKHRNSATIFVILCLFLFIGCKKKISFDSHVKIVDILGAYERKEEVPVSSIADSIEYIQLSDSEGRVLDVIAFLNVSDSLIMEINSRYIYIFSRKTGRLMYEISSFGRGPDEHSNFEAFDEDNLLIIESKLDSKDAKIGFSLNGKKTFQFNAPKSIFDDDNPYWIMSVYPVSKNRFAGYINNSNGKVKDKLVIFDQSGSIIKIYPNYNSFSIKKNYGYIDGNKQRQFFNYADTVRFLESCTDTIFSVTEKDLIESYYLKMGRFSPPYHLQAVCRDPEIEKEQEWLSYFNVRILGESKRFLFFNLEYDFYKHIGYYDKINKGTFVCDLKSDKEYYKYPAVYPLRNIGFENDIDNFIPIGTGSDPYYVNKNGELITFIEAAEVERWFRNNPDKAAKLPERLKKFSNVKATDNIIVEVIHLKK